MSFTAIWFVNRSLSTCNCSHPLAMDGQQQDQAENLGDIDGDGKIDIGGAQNTIGMWGISLGGIISGGLAGAEPAIDAISQMWRCWAGGCHGSSTSSGVPMLSSSP